MDRDYSCSGGGNEGDAGVGANHIPGTPTGPSANSWMLACSGGGDRPFTASDITALRNTYGLNTTGSRFVCTGNVNFSITDVIPPGSTVTWTAAPANLFQQATGTGATATLRAANTLVRGEATVTFRIVTATGAIVLGEETTWVGKPFVRTNPDGVPAIQAQIGSMVTVRAIADGNSATSYNWWITGNSSGANLYAGSSSVAVIECLSPGTYHLYVTGTNTCGTGSSWHVPINVSSNGGGGDGPQWPK